MTLMSITANLETLAYDTSNPETFNNNPLQYTLWISYSIQFAKGHSKAAMESRSEVYIITPTFATIFCLTNKIINKRAQKIDSFFIK